MNNERRKRLEELRVKIEAIQSIVEEIREEEQDYMDNMPENLQGSERYEKAECAVDELYSAYESLETAADSITEAME